MPIFSLDFHYISLFPSGSFSQLSKWIFCNKFSMHIFRNLGFLFSKAIVGNRLLAKFGKSESNGNKNKKTPRGLSLLCTHAEKSIINKLQKSRKQQNEINHAAKYIRAGQTDSVTVHFWRRHRSQGRCATHVAWNRWHIVITCQRRLHAQPPSTPHPSLPFCCALHCRPSWQKFIFIPMSPCHNLMDFQVISGILL